MENAIKQSKTKNVAEIIIKGILLLLIMFSFSVGNSFLFILFPHVISITSDALKFFQSSVALFFIGFAPVWFAIVSILILMLSHGYLCGQVLKSKGWFDAHRKK